MRRFAATIRLVFERLRLRPGFWAGVLLALLVAVALLAGAVGAAAVPMLHAPRAILDPAHPAHAVLVQIRLPRIAAGMLVGGALAVAGALLQAVVRNPIADPGILGVTAGAGLGGLLAICLWPEHPELIPL